MTSKKISLNTKIILALSAGLLVGMTVGDSRVGDFLKEYIIFGLFYTIGQLFLNTLSMLVVPVVLLSLVSGIAGLGNIKRITKLGGITIGYYFFTSVVAVILSISAAYIIKPGEKILELKDTFKLHQGESFSKAFINFFPSNPFASIEQGNMVQIIVFTILVGISISILGKKVEGTINLFRQANKLVLKMINMVMSVAPIGIFALVINVFAREGFDAFAPMLKYMGTIVIVLLIQFFFVYGGIIKMIGLSPEMFLRKMKQVILTSFATSSSNATLPIAMSAMQYKCGVSHKITSAALPFGVSVNKDGTAIMQGVAVIFISQAYGIDLTFTALVTALIFAIISTIGTAGIPGAGMISIGLVLSQVGLPIEGIALIIGVDRLLDMSRTVINLVGNSVGALLVAKMDGKLNELVYNDPDAGIREEKTIGEFGQEISINRHLILETQKLEDPDLN
jgi:Na+/H+-dicarboxylate symporter